MFNYLGLDIGGTKIAAGLVGRAGIVVKKTEEPTNAHLGFSGILTSVEECLKNLSPERVAGVGIGVAGQVDTEKGILVYAPNMPKIKNAPIVTEIRRLLGKRISSKGLIKVDNDANCFVLAEHRVGAGKGFNDVVLLTLGTGVGGGLIIKNELYRGQSFASELGHMVILAEGRKCSCGLRGHLEAYVSGTSIAKIYFEKTGVRKKAHEIEVEALKNQNGQAFAIYHEAAKYLGLGLASLINILDPDLIILGGGIGRSKLIYEHAAEVCAQNIFFKNRITKIVQSKLSNEAAIIGAAMLCF